MPASAEATFPRSYHLTRGADGRNHWIYVGLPGHDDDKGRELDEATLNRVHYWSRNQA